MTLYINRPLKVLCSMLHEHPGEKQAVVVYTLLASVLGKYFHGMHLNRGGDRSAQLWDKFHSRGCSGSGHGIPPWHSREAAGAEGWPHHPALAMGESHALVPRSCLLVAAGREK